MASTNSYNFAVTRDNLITDAMLHIQAIGEGETPSANSVTEAARILNMLVKLRAADGMPLWSLKRGVILPVTGVSSVNTVSHIVQAGSYVETKVNGAEAASQTVISVDSATGIAGSDQIGIELDDGTMHWTTVSSVSSNDITIASGLASAAADDSKVYAYTASSDRIPRPIRVIEANILETTDDISWEIDIEDRDDYYNLGSRTTASIPNMLYYDASLGDNTADPTSSTTWYGTFYIYPRFEGGDHLIEFTYQRPEQDFDAAGDHPGFPQEFYLPIMLELAALLGPRHNVPAKERATLFAEAEYYRKAALETIAPEGSTTIQPDIQE